MYKISIKFLLLKSIIFQVKSQKEFASTPTTNSSTSTAEFSTLCFLNTDCDGTNMYCDFPDGYCGDGSKKNYYFIYFIHTFSSFFHNSYGLI